MFRSSWSPRIALKSKGRAANRLGRCAWTRWPPPLTRARAAAQVRGRARLCEQGRPAPLALARRDHAGDAVRLLFARPPLLSSSLPPCAVPVPSSSLSLRHARLATGPAPLPWVASPDAPSPPHLHHHPDPTNLTDLAELSQPRRDQGPSVEGAARVRDVGRRPVARAQGATARASSSCPPPRPRVLLAPALAVSPSWDPPPHPSGCPHQPSPTAERSPVPVPHVARGSG